MTVKQCAGNRGFYFLQPGQPAGGHHLATVLTGAGPCFSAGVDLIRVTKEGTPYLQKFLPELHNALLRLFTFPKPIVAAINGHAIAGGCILAWACDHKIMAADSGRLGVAELAVGVPFPALPLEIVRFAVPTHYFQEVVYGAETYEPQTALAMGLVDELAPPDTLMQRAGKVARRYAAIRPEALRLTKALMRRPALDRVENCPEDMLREIDHFWQTPEAIQAIKTFLAKTVGK